MTRKYPVIFEWSGKNFGGYAPDIPGCMATAKTLPEIKKLLKGALEAHLKWMFDDGDALPCASDTVTVDMEPDAEFPQPRGYYVVVETLEIKMPEAKVAKTIVSRSKKSTTTKRRTLQAA
jgi:predicted RNase H-like HicB family nuclease